MLRLSMMSILVVTVLAGCGEPANEPTPTPSKAPAHDAQSADPVKEQPAATTPEPESFTDDKLKLTFPPRLGHLTFVEYYPEDDAGVGYSIRYQNSNHLKIDIYVFDKGQLTIPDGPASPQVAKELAASDFSIRHKESTKMYLDVEQLATGTFPENLGPTDVAYLFSRYQYRQAAQRGVSFTGDLISETFVRGYRDHFLKIRVSYPKKLEAASIADRDVLLQHLAAEIRAGAEHPTEN